MDPLQDVELYRGLERSLGADVASALMLRLPAQPVHELATKQDLRDLEDRLTAHLEHRFDEHLTLRLSETENRILAVMRGEMIAAIHTQGRQMALTLLGALVSLTLLAYAIAHT